MRPMPATTDATGVCEHSPGDRSVRMGQSSFKTSIADWLHRWNRGQRDQTRWFTKGGAPISTVLVRRQGSSGGSVT